MNYKVDRWSVLQIWLRSYKNIWNISLNNSRIKNCSFKLSLSWFEPDVAWRKYDARTFRFHTCYYILYQRRGHQVLRNMFVQLAILSWTARWRPLEYMCEIYAVSDLRIKCDISYRFVCSSVSFFIFNDSSTHTKLVKCHCVDECTWLRYHERGRKK